MRKALLTIFVTLGIWSATLSGCTHNLTMRHGQTAIERIGYAPGNETAVMRIAPDGTITVTYKSERGIIWEAFAPVMLWMAKGL